MLPNFFVIGAQKAGTTTLHNLLAAHPDIYVPTQKETKFFADDRRYAAGLVGYEKNYFSGWDGENAVGEVDPDYMYFPHVLERMRKDIDLNSTKFVFLLRNPIDRAFSHYLMTYRRGLERLSFGEALDAEPERIRQDYLSNMHYSYASRGFYWEQISRFSGYVDASRMLFLLSEELQRDPAGSIRRLYGFLGVDADFMPTDAGRTDHRATAPKSMLLLDRVNKKESFEKRLIRVLLPFKSLRHAIRQSLLDWNQTDKRMPVLEDVERDRLKNLYQKANQILAEKTSLDVSGW